MIMLHQSFDPSLWGMWILIGSFVAVLVAFVWKPRRP